jgi:hypothetical protein
MDMMPDFIKPTKKKLALFAVLSVALLYLPVIPTLSAPVVKDPVYQWGVKSFAASLGDMDLMGVSDRYFGTLSGANASVLGILYIIAIGYILACVIAYVFHSMNK